MPGIQSSRRGTTCFCPPSQMLSVTKGRAIPDRVLRTAVVLWVSLTTSKPPYARWISSGIIKCGSSIARARSAPWAKLVDTGSLANIARSAGVFRILTKARRIEGFNLWIWKQRWIQYTWSRYKQHTTGVLHASWCSSFQRLVNSDASRWIKVANFIFVN